MSWRAPARRYPVLAVRDFRILLADRLLAPFSAGFSLVGVSFAVLKVTGSTADLSYVIAAQTAPMLVFSLLSGVFADRFPPQRVIVAGNLCIVVGEGVFGLLMLTTGHPPLWAMIGLEAVNGIGAAVFYPASNALLPQLVPDALLQEGSSISRLAMNIGQMTGAAAAGVLVAAAGPGWALTLCAAGMSGTVPLMLAVKGVRRHLPLASKNPSMLAELREGWTEFRRHTWLWATVLQYGLVMMAWNGSFLVLGPVVARAHLGGAAAWGAISATEAVGLIAGGLVSLRYTPRRPMLFVVGTGALFALSPLVLGLVAPLPVICVTACGLGLIAEVMMVQWTVAMATRIPADKLARVSSYDAFGSMAAMPLGALVVGPLAASVGVSATQFAAAAVILVASACTLIPRDIWTIRSDDGVTGASGGPVTGETADTVAATRLPAASAGDHQCGFWRRPGMSDPRRSVRGMNLPRRLSGRRSRPECPGHAQQADGPGRDPERAEYMSWIAATVGEHGWAISGRHGDEAAPPWAYSVGMWLTCQVPELVLCGLPVDSAAGIINAIGSRIADGEDFGPDQVLDDVCAAPLALRPVEPSWRAADGLLTISDVFYGMVRPPYLQVVWSDRDGRFPWEQGFQPAFDRMQPLLWLPRDDNPPAPWTRLDQLP